MRTFLLVVRNGAITQKNQEDGSWWRLDYGAVDKCIKSDNLILMKKMEISVTEAARNFADCVNRAHYQNVTFVLLKNGAPFARLSPDGEKVCTGRQLAEILKDAHLPKEEARAWHGELHAARKKFKPPVDKWR
jgi:hypothetical protein